MDLRIEDLEVLLWKCVSGKALKRKGKTYQRREVLLRLERRYLVGWISRGAAVSTWSDTRGIGVRKEEGIRSYVWNGEGVETKE